MVVLVCVMYVMCVHAHICTWYVCAYVYMGVTNVHTHMHTIFTVFTRRAALNEDMLSSQYCCLEIAELTLGLWGWGQREAFANTPEESRRAFLLGATKCQLGNCLASLSLCFLMCKW